MVGVRCVSRRFGQSGASTGEQPAVLVAGMGPGMHHLLFRCWGVEQVRACVSMGSSFYGFLFSCVLKSCQARGLFWVVGCCFFLGGSFFVFVFCLFVCFLDCLFLSTSGCSRNGCRCLSLFFFFRVSIRFVKRYTLAFLKPIDGCGRNGSHVFIATYSGVCESCQVQTQHDIVFLQSYQWLW